MWHSYEIHRPATTPHLEHTPEVAYLFSKLFLFVVWFVALLRHEGNDGDDENGLQKHMAYNRSACKGKINLSASWEEYVSSNIENEMAHTRIWTGA